MVKSLYFKVIMVITFLIVFIAGVSLIINKSKFEILSYNNVFSALYNDKYLVGTPVKWKGMFRPKVEEIYFTKEFGESVRQDFVNDFKCYVSEDMSIGTSLKSEISKDSLQSYKDYRLKEKTLNIIVEAEPNNIIKLKEYKFLVIHYDILNFDKKVYLRMD